METFESFCERHAYPKDISTSSLMKLLECEELTEDTYKPNFRLLLYLDELEHARKMIFE